MARRGVRPHKLRTHNKGGRFGGAPHSSNARPPRPVSTKRYGR